MEHAEQITAIVRAPHDADVPPMSTPASLPTTIADEVLELITRGTFPPGFQLRPAELAERFSTTRSALQEALKLLNAQGVVEHDPDRGFLVAAVSAHEARQLYWIRRQLETELLRTARWPSKERLAELRVLLVAAENALRAGDTASWLANHRRFFSAVFDLSPDSVLAHEGMRLLRRTDRYRALAPHALHSAARRAMQERRILSALRQRDRVRLLSVFDTERTRIENGVQRMLRDLGR